MTLDPSQFQHPIAIAPNDFLWVRGWLEPAEASVLEAQIVAETLDRATVQKSFGPNGPYWNKFKRMVRFGDEDVTYTYKGKPKPVFPWTPSLSRVRALVEDALDHTFNCVVVNFYDNEDADLYPHSDIKYIPQLGSEPIIAAVSFGAERSFIIREGSSGKGVDHTVDLGHGDLFVMRGKSQTDYRHGLLRSEVPKGRRVSLTFRKHLV